MNKRNGIQLETGTYDPKNNLLTNNRTEYDAAGRAIETRREINNVGGNISASTVVLSKTWYKAIGKVERSVNELGLATEYDYDELGNLVETRNYDSNDALMTVSRNLYEVLITFGP